MVREMLTDQRLHDALGRQLIFLRPGAADRNPLGILIALAMPQKGWTASASLVLLAMPLLIPWNVIGTIWIIFTRPDIGLFGVWINGLGCWMFLRSHRPTPLCLDHADAHGGLALDAAGGPAGYAGLRSIPEAYYQAAKIDGASRWAVFRFIQLPKMRGVLTIAVLLRFMDSF
jgi:glycerol transport system permease protein